MNRKKTFVPIIIALGITIGLFIGNFYGSRFSSNKKSSSIPSSVIYSSNNKLNDLLQLINAQYVDTVDIKSIIEKTVPKLLSELDPHSTYTSAKEVETAMQGLKGSFSGIGVQFLIHRDTINVVEVIEGGPSARTGLMAGDRIVKVNDSIFVGKEINNDTAMKTLKGPMNSVIKLTVYRPSKDTMMDFKITRGKVPVKSIASSYMIDDQTGYIKIKTFGETTYSELLAALAQLNHEGVQNLIIDLRDNLGGYLQTAIQMINEFLPNNSLIVYTEGRKFPRQDYKSDGRGTYKNIPIVILVNEASASASEIFSGAIQDNDRGTIIGRRTFGKGLVQEPVEFRDGSLLRLTIARYYTPSGRCVQKPYVNGKGKDYEKDLYNRAMHGEFYSRDSIKPEGKKYKTINGRTVYGGGGIIPDIFIPADTIGYSSYLHEARVSGKIGMFGYIYSDVNRTKLSEFETTEELVAYLKTQHIPEKFSVYAAKNGLKFRSKMFQKSYKIIERFLFSIIVDDVKGESCFWQYLNTDDDYINASLKVFENKSAFPHISNKETMNSDSISKK